jgi:hypothetical protein
MRRTHVVTIAVLIVAGTLAACKSSPPPVQGIDTPTGGSIGHNGLTPDVYHAHKDELQALMKVQLTPAAGHLNADFATVLGASKTLVDYSVSCAVAKGTVTAFGLTSYSADTAYTGPGNLIKSTTGWPGTSLAKDQREDLHTCLATRLNPSGAEVSIWLGGLAVPDDSADHTAFVVDEALWAAAERTGDSPSTPDLLTIDVWPSDALRTSCANNLIAALGKRVCGTYAGTAKCGLTMREDRSDCREASGIWSCPRSPAGSGSGSGSGIIPVIQTRLRCADWCTFYPGCAAPKSLCPTLPACPTDAGPR